MAGDLAREIASYGTSGWLQIDRQRSPEWPLASAPEPILGLVDEPEVPATGESDPGLVAASEEHDEQDEKDARRAARDAQEGDR